MNDLNKKIMRIVNGTLLYPSPKLKKEIAAYFNCKEEEICFGDGYFEGEENENITVCPYKIILGNVSFQYTNIKYLDKLKYIAGDACFAYSKVIDLGELTVIGKDADFIGCSKLKNLNKLTNVGGDVSLIYCDELEGLGNLTNVGGDFSLSTFNSKKITSLENLTKVGKSVHIDGDSLKSLGKLTKIGKDLNISFADNITSLENVKFIGGILYCWGRDSLDFGALEYVKRFDCNQELGELIIQEFDEKGYRIDKEERESRRVRR